MKITIHAIGKIKESYWNAAITEYSKRLSAYCQIEIIEYPDLPCPESSSLKEEEEIKSKECLKILSSIKNGDRVIALDLGHDELTSPSFASFLQKEMELGGAKLNFVIGGSLGLSDELKKRADSFLTFGKMTFPHQLARVMLLEQLYRAYRIQNNQPYHK